MEKIILYKKIISTKLGEMIALSNDTHLLFLDFNDKSNIDEIINKLKFDLNAEIVLKDNNILKQTTLELDNYFIDPNHKFSVPIMMIGTEFRKKVWNELIKIKSGTTMSYKDIAININNNKAMRAVGSANSKNKILIIIPCHRVVDNKGTIGGFSAGISRKIWLLEHEKKQKH